MVFEGQNIFVPYIFQTLREVSPLGLSIYGGGWDLHEDAAELLPFWRGILPLGDIASLYASAKVMYGNKRQFSSDETAKPKNNTYLRVFHVKQWRHRYFPFPRR